MWRQTDGKIVVAGTTGDGTAQMMILRWLATMATSFFHQAAIVQ
jgi:hypothetical protein